MTETSINFSGSVPQFYEEGLVPVIFEDYAEEIAKRASRDLGSIEKGTLLELASGTGVVTRELRSALGGGIDVIASDLNADMLDIARSKFSDDEAVRFDVVDAMNLPFEPASLDGVVCQFGVMFFPDKAQSYRQVHNVLKPGGVYSFNAWDSHAENPYAKIGQDLVEEIFPDEPPGFYHVPFHYHDPDQIRDDLRQAGFEDITIEQVKLQKTVRSPQSFARSFVFGNPLREEIEARSGDAEAFITEIHARLEKAFGKDPMVFPLSAFFVRAVK